MWLLDKMLKKVVKKGDLTVIDHDGKEYHYGDGQPAPHGPVRVRFTDKGAANHIIKDPRVGAGEVFMDGRMVVEQGNLRDLILLIRYNAPVERQGPLKPKGAVRRGIGRIAGRLDQINWKTRSAKNAEHTYNLTRRLYELFLD